MIRTQRLDLVPGAATQLRAELAGREAGADPDAPAGEPVLRDERARDDR